MNDLPSNQPLTQAEAQNLIHELRVHQIELEMQNEELRRTQRELQASHDRFFDLFHKAPVGYLVIDGLGQISSANETFCLMVGRLPGEIMDRPFFDLVSKPDQSLLRSRFKAIFKNPAGKWLELRLLDGQGKDFFTRLEFRSVPDSMLPPNLPSRDRLLMTVNNINERKQIEKALEVSEERYRFLYHKTPAMLHSIDQQGLIVDVSDFWLQYLGYQQDEVIGMKFTDFLTEASQQYANKTELPIFFNQGIVQDIHYQFVKKNGQVVDALLSAIAEKDEEGRFNKSLAVSFDITNRLRMEESLLRWAHIFEHAAWGVAVSSQDGESLSLMNPYFAQMHGYSVEELTGQSFKVVCAPEEHDLLPQHIHQADITGHYTFEAMHIQKDGSKFPAYIDITSVKDDEGEVLYRVVNTLDISERRKMEAVLQEERQLLAQRVEERTAELSIANRQLEQAARLKDEFMAAISHELRTPLTAILGYSEALQKNVYGELTPPQMKALRSIEISGASLLTLINDILDFTRILAGSLEIFLTPIHIESLCLERIRFVQQAASKKRLRVSTFFDSQMDFLMADEKRLGQILDNLLSNAVKFTPEGGSFGLEIQGFPESGVVDITVWDTGIGISTEDQVRLFQPFLQLDGSLARAYNGTGLGLIMVRRLAELHHGRVWVESEPGRGSRFTVRLPWIIQPIEPQSG